MSDIGIEPCNPHGEAGNHGGKPDQDAYAADAHGSCGVPVVTAIDREAEADTP